MSSRMYIVLRSGRMLLDAFNFVPSRTCEIHWFNSRFSVLFASSCRHCSDTFSFESAVFEVQTTELVALNFYLRAA